MVTFEPQPTTNNFSVFNCRDGQTIPKVRFITWLGLHDRLPTSACLAKQNQIPSPCCQLCKNNEETLDHLLLFCPVFQGVQDRFAPSFTRDVRLSFSTILFHLKFNSPTNQLPQVLLAHVDNQKQLHFPQWTVWPLEIQYSYFKLKKRCLHQIPSLSSYSAHCDPLQMVSSPYFLCLY